MSEFDPDDFEEEKRASFLQVLFKTARLANEDALATIHEQVGDDRIRPAHTSLFPHIPFDGIRLTELSGRLGVTKQATQQLVDELEEMELVERLPDPSDGRAKLIRWSKEGRAAMSRGVGFLRELEPKYASIVGAERLRDAHEVLLEILAALEEE